jgi:predicted nucleic acid-binding protein
MTILIDTGPLYAFFDQNDQYNYWTGRQFAKITQPLLTCEAVIAETVFLMLGSGISPEYLFTFIQRGHLKISHVLANSDQILKIGNIIIKYNDLPASFADACLVEMYEKKSPAKIFTLDKHFSIYRTSKSKPLSLISPH